MQSSWPFLRVIFWPHNSFLKYISTKNYIICMCSKLNSNTAQQQKNSKTCNKVNLSPNMKPINSKWKSNHLQQFFCSKCKDGPCPRIFQLHPYQTSLTQSVQACFSMYTCSLSFCVHAHLNCFKQLDDTMLDNTKTKQARWKLNAMLHVITCMTTSIWHAWH
jgi:hypothetical protein